MGSSRLIILLYLYHSWSEVLCSPVKCASYVSDWSDAGPLLQKHKGPIEPNDSHFPEKPGSFAHVKSSSSVIRPNAPTEYRSKLKTPSSPLPVKMSIFSKNRSKPEKPSAQMQQHFKPETPNSLLPVKSSVFLEKPSAPMELHSTPSEMSSSRFSEKHGSKPERPSAPIEYRSKLSSPLPVKMSIFSKNRSKPEKPSALRRPIFSLPSEKSNSKPEKPSAQMQH